MPHDGITVKNTESSTAMTLFDKMINLDIIATIANYIRTKTLHPEGTFF